MFTFAGMPVVIQGPKLLRRTWAERLFSWPWHPRLRFKMVPPVIADGQVYRVNDTWIMTNQTWSRLSKELDKLPSTTNSLYKSETLC